MIKNGEKHLCAFVELIKGKSVSEDELIKFCRVKIFVQHQGSIKMPKKIVFCEFTKNIYIGLKIQKFDCIRKSIKKKSQ